MAETKGMTITELDDENDVSLKICYHSCKYKSKKIFCRNSLEAKNTCTISFYRV